MPFSYEQHQKFALSGVLVLVVVVAVSCCVAVGRPVAVFGNRQGISDENRQETIRSSRLSVHRYHHTGGL